jgi:hypothetical protein
MIDVPGPARVIQSDLQFDGEEEDPGNVRYGAGP